MIRSTPSSRARRAASAPRMPQSTDTTRATPVGVQPIDRRRLQPVAVAQTLGDEVDHVGAEQFEGAAQDDGRRDAVHVVVAVDGDPFFARDGAHDPIDRHAHVGQPHRIVQVIERRVQKSTRELRIAEPALTQQPRDGRLDAQRRRQPTRRLLRRSPVTARSVRQWASDAVLRLLVMCSSSSTTEDTDTTRRNKRVLHADVTDHHH